MAKATYSAVVEGKKITRSTNRTYTHAVVWVSEKKEIVKARAFAGSLSLAQKQVNKYATVGVYRADELEGMGLNPDNFEALPDRNPDYRFLPGEIIVVPVELEV